MTTPSQKLSDNADFAVNRDVDVLVVGAGISGLTIAYELAIKKSHRVMVAEAQDRVGGAIVS